MNHSHTHMHAQGPGGGDGMGGGWEGSLWRRRGWFGDEESVSVMGREFCDEEERVL